MTKIGEGDNPHKQADRALYHKQLDQGAAKFENALISYSITTDTQQRAQLKAIMDEQLGLIQSAVRELRRAGFYKEDVVVEKDYKNYIALNNDQNLSALEQDLQTLRDYNKMP
jgi:hypothetical protein